MQAAAYQNLHSPYTGRQNSYIQSCSPTPKRKIMGAKIGVEETKEESKKVPRFSSVATIDDDRQPIPNASQGQTCFLMTSEDRYYNYNYAFEMNEDGTYRILFTRPGNSDIPVDS